VWPLAAQDARERVLRCSEKTMIGILLSRASAIADASITLRSLERTSRNERRSKRRASGWRFGSAE